MKLTKESVKNEDKLWEEKRKTYRYCKCGTARPFPKFKDKLICPNCGNYIYKDKKIEFKEKMKGILRKI